jgi:hypothetical protein
MSAPLKKSPLALPVSKQEDCLRELKSAGATPVHMILYSVLNFAMPSMFRNLMWAAVTVGLAYLGAINK